MPVTLSSLIEQTKEDETLLPEILSSFSCSKDADIESFLYNRAVQFDNLSKARTYLICDEDQILSDGFSLDRLVIYGYISIAPKILSVPPETSTNKRKKLDGLSAKIHGKPISDFPCYLIGQLAKNSNIENNPLSGKELLQFSYDIIQAAADAVGGRYMMIECHDNDKLIKFYTDNKFDEISRMSDGETLLVQMIRQIY